MSLFFLQNHLPRGIYLQVSVICFLTTQLETTLLDENKITPPR